MAHIVIRITSQITGRGGFRLTGEALVAPGDDASVPMPFTTPDIPWTETSAQVNQTIQDAAIAMVASFGYQVAPFDNKIVIGGAVGVM